MPGYYYSPESWITRIVDALAQMFTAAVIKAMEGIISALGNKTEPDFQAIVPIYDKMLAVSLLLIGGILAGALVERLLGGKHGGGWNLVGRTGAAVALAFLGLPVLRYLAYYAHLLAFIYGFDYVDRAHELVHKVLHLYSGAGLSHPALGSALGLIVTGSLALLLALLLHIELYLRAALILVTATFIPFLSVLAIWPRFMSAAGHLLDFLVALLLAKFLMATAVYVGFALMIGGLGGPGDDGSNVMVTGIAVLAVATLAPLALFQGVRFGHHAAAPVARTWSASAFGFSQASFKSAGRYGQQGWQVAKRRLAAARAPRQEAP